MMSVADLLPTLTASILLLTALTSARDVRPHHRRRHSPDLLLRDLLTDTQLADTSRHPARNPPPAPEAARRLLETVGYSSDRHTPDSPSALPDLQLTDFLAAMADVGLVDVKYEGGPVSEFMLDLYRRLEAGEQLPRAAGHRDVDVAILRSDTVRGLAAKEITDRQRVSVLSFNLSSFSRHEETQKAELRLRMPQRGEGQEVLKFKVKVKVFRAGELVDEVKYSVRVETELDSDTIILDLTAVLKSVIGRGHGDTQIEVRLRRKPTRSGESRAPAALTRRRRQRRSLAAGQDEDLAHTKAILVVYTKDKKFFEKFSLSHAPQQQTRGREEAASNPTTRQKRSTADRRSQRTADQTTESRGLCTKKDFIIDFDAVGWGEWIIYPKRYNAYQCSGRCPSPVDSSYHPTNHAILQSILRIGNKHVARPCCAPTKLKPLSMLYYEYNEIVVRHHEDMIVDQCGCR